jgi:aspartate racemase
MTFVKMISGLTVILDKMQRIGILGGMAPESTVEYYRTIIEASHERGWEKRYPQTYINSLNFEEFYDPLSNGEDDTVFEVLSGGVEDLASAGADFALLASNTPHKYFEAVASDASIPMLSIVDATGDAAVDRGFERVGLLGTLFTMEGDFYPTGFEERGLDLATPTQNEREWVHEKIFSELTNGQFSDETKVGLIEAVEGMQKRDDIDAVALACTELPLILDESDLDVQILNTTELHARAAFDRATLRAEPPQAD